ncbi:methyl-accepting chemotaxis protein [Clostridium grantii]|uniref:HAMP domain-containing protein n=1 Tax=Clostridium grantii DSM 8605 TaxID=1121316 RepID=A0A1M5XM39_9CLOT|nr:methyl-accepting chemotaxis protein [Clostridium grantii]SHI00722.1 HAMP domain-containing protein [Clostridium grantii DSM 8605]
MRFFKKLSMRNKIMSFLVPAFIITISLIVGVIIVQFENYTINVNKEQAIKGMEGLNEIIEKYKNESSNLSKLISQNPDIVKYMDEGNADGLRDILTIISKDLNVDFITVTDKNGLVLYRTNTPNESGDSIINQINIQKALEGNVYTTLENIDSQELLAVTGSPIINMNKEIIGVISTGFELSNVDILDNSKKIYKTDLTIFLNDVRLNTTIIKNGERVVGTQLNPAIAKKILEDKEQYIAEAEILDMPYICSYMPLMNTNNDVIGVVFSGQLKSDAVKKMNEIIFLIFVISVVVLIVISVFIFFFSLNVISKPLEKIMEASNKISNGDLYIDDFDINETDNTKDEIIILSKSFYEMVNTMNMLINNINASSEQVSAGAIQVSDSSTSLAQGATEQASSVEQLSASIEEISSQTIENAKNATTAKKVVENANYYTTICDKQMQGLLNSMTDINNSSNNISKIIKVIDDIAFKTNILALNAAVEAARAGQHGKGFAVVAEEVRNLATRSANATKEISIMIENSLKTVNQGANISTDTADALKNIVIEISKASDLIESIAVSSNEQSIGINQINQGILQIANVVQSTSATSEETAAASEELSSQAAMLKQQVAGFNLKK